MGLKRKKRGVFMKSYLRLFLISISFTFILNIAQAEIPEIIYQAQNSVYKIVSTDKYGQVLSSGTAFAIAKDRVVTAFHNLKGQADNMYLINGDQRIQVSEVLTVSVADDLGLLKLHGEILDYLDINNTNLLSSIKNFNSEILYIPGYPKGNKKIRISLPQYGVRNLDNDNGLQIVVKQSDEAKGMSGSPILDRTGAVVGMAYANLGHIFHFREVSKIKQLENGSIGIDCSGLSVSACIERAIEKAKQGDDARSLYEVAKIYLKLGRDTEAVSLMKESADKGYVPALYVIAEMSLEGGNRILDYEQALSSMEKMASKGYILAQSYMVPKYFEGREVQKNDKKGINLLKKMAKQGSIQSIHNLVQLYVHGRYGVKPNETEARNWLTRATELGDVTATILLAIASQMADLDSSQNQTFNESNQRDPLPCHNVFK